MSNLAIEGLISGFNTTELIDAILDIQVRAPVKQIESRVTKETARLTALQSINATLLGVEISTQSLGTQSLFEGKKITSSAPNSVSASVNSSASVGSFSIGVMNLAKSDQISSDIFISPSDEVGTSGRFIINGKLIDVSANDTYASMANQINAANAGVKAQIVQIAPNQSKLVIESTSTGFNTLEMREVGASGLLTSLGLLHENANLVKFDYTVNANTKGALSGAKDPTYTLSYGKGYDVSFTVTDAGGQNSLTVHLTDQSDPLDPMDPPTEYTLSDIAQAINDAAAQQGANISAGVIDDNGKKRLAINSSTGIPSEFQDPDNVLFDLGVVSGIQSASFLNSAVPVGQLLGLGDTDSHTVTLTDGDGSDTFSVSIDLDTDGLQDIVDKINEEAINRGSDITARIISANSQRRIELSSATGRPLISNDPSVNYDPVNNDPGNIMQTLGFVSRDFNHFDQQGENSQFTYNGIVINRTSNLVTDLVTGVSLALVSENATPANISITEDYSNVSEILNDFVDAYNTLASKISELTLFDPKGKNHGPLFGNSLMRDLENAMAGGISRNIPNLPGLNVFDLNDGNGIDLGKIKITDRKGNSAEIDLSGARTVQDILDEINLTSEIQVRAEINSAGTGLALIDQSGGTQQFLVEDVDGTTAEDLGIRRNIFSNEIAGSQIYQGGNFSLASIGIRLNVDGTLSLNESELQQALNENPDRVKNLIQASRVGFVDQFKSTLREYTTFGTGRMDISTNAVTSRIESLNKQIERYNTRANNLRKSLELQFTNLEITFAKSQQMSQYLSERLSAQPSK